MNSLDFDSCSAHRFGLQKPNPSLLALKPLARSAIFNPGSYRGYLSSLLNAEARLFNCHYGDMFCKCGGFKKFAIIRPAINRNSHIDNFAFKKTPLILRNKFVELVAFLFLRTPPCAATPYREVFCDSLELEIQTDFGLECTRADLRIQIAKRTRDEAERIPVK